MFPIEKHDDVAMITRTSSNDGVRILLLFQKRLVLLMVVCATQTHTLTHMCQHSQHSHMLM